MFNNELLLYVDPTPVNYYDMFIVLFHRWELEFEERIGESLDWYKEKCIDEKSVDTFLKWKLLIEVEDDLYDVNNRFLADRMFVSIDKEMAILIYDLIINECVPKIADYLLGLYTFLLSRSNIKAFKGDLNNFQFSIKYICKMLKMTYTQKNRDCVASMLECLQDIGLISYKKLKRSYTMYPYELIGIKIKADEPLMNVEDVFNKYYKGAKDE